MAWTCLQTIQINGTTYNLPYVHDGWAGVIGDDNNAGAYYQITDTISGTFPFYNTSLNSGSTNLDFPNNDRLSFDYILSSSIGSLQFKILNGSNYLVLQTVGLVSTSADTLAFGIVVDDSTQRARIFLMEHDSNSNEWIKSAAYNIYTGTDTDLERLYTAIHSVPSYTSNGGGATHIAKVTGQLKDLSSNLSDILMVSGGGGGGYLSGTNVYSGADAGGISGSGSNSADQSTGYAFGQGESGTNKSGGGGGLYGGYKSDI